MISHEVQRGTTSLVAWLCILAFLATASLCGQAHGQKSAKLDTVKTLQFARQLEEEKRENDKRVPQEEIDRLLAGTRGFESDKLSAFSASEQSKIMQQISEFAGVPYEVGGNSKDGIDCASFVALVYKNAIELQLPRSSVDQFYYCKMLPDDEGHFGDLIFFRTTGQRASHVGIYLGNQLFAHASVSMGVTISTLESSYYKKRFDGVRRIIRE